MMSRPFFNNAVSWVEPSLRNLSKPNVSWMEPSLRNLSEPVPFLRNLSEPNISWMEPSLRNLSEPVPFLRELSEPNISWMEASLRNLSEPVPFLRNLSEPGDQISGHCPKPPRSFIGRTPSLSGCWGKKKKKLPSSLPQKNARSPSRCRRDTAASTRRAPANSQPSKAPRTPRLSESPNPWRGALSLQRKRFCLWFCCLWVSFFLWAWNRFWPPPLDGLAPPAGPSAGAEIPVAAVVIISMWFSRKPWFSGDFLVIF